MKKSTFNFSLIAIAVIGAIVASFLYKNMTERPKYVSVQVQKGEVSEVLDLSGSVKPQDSADLGFELGGKITGLNHQVGDFVPAGTILATADMTDLQAAYQQAEDLAKGAQANLNQYESLLDKAKQQLKSLEHNDAISSDKKAQQAQIEASEAQVAAQQQVLAAAQANVVIAKAQLGKKIITAPFAGIIAKEDVKVGEAVQSNAPIITLISKDTFKIEAYASQTDIRNLTVGNKAQVTLDNNPGQAYAAKITAVDPAESMINGVSNYKVTLAFADAIADLRSGIGADVAVAGQVKTGVVVVPKDAVFEQNNKKYVYVSEDGIRVQKEIETGIYGSNGLVEITSGLDADNNVLALSK